MSTEHQNGKGKKEGQKYKSLLVWYLLLKRTDENHAMSISDIQTALENYGIQAERHSISRDISALNDLMNIDNDLAAADELDERELLNYSLGYDKSLHGYKVIQRPYEFENIRLLAECVHNAKFITSQQEHELLDTIEYFCSDAQIEELKNDIYLVGRQKSINKSIMNALRVINEAIHHNNKIIFKYQKYILNSSNQSEQVERKRGTTYRVSPYKIIINDGFYYLLSYSSQYQAMRTFRLDRMKEVKLLQEARDGSEEYSKIDIQNYTHQVFSMVSGKKERVTICFINSLLDAVIDRFGTGKDVRYNKKDDHHFLLTAEVEISDQFFSWICGFRKRAYIVAPDEIVKQMNTFLSDIESRYAQDEEGDQNLNHSGLQDVKS